MAPRGGTRLTRIKIGDRELVGDAWLVNDDGVVRGILLPTADRIDLFAFDARLRPRGSYNPDFPSLEDATRWLRRRLRAA